MVAVYPAALFTLCSLLQGARQVQLEFNTSSFSDEEIWVLLTRHVTDTHRTSDFIALKVEIEDDLIPISSIVENQHTLSFKVCLPTLPL
jgi:calpain-7